MGLLQGLLWVLILTLNLKVFVNATLLVWNRYGNETRLSECQVLGSDWTFLEDIAAVLQSDTDVILCSKVIHLDKVIKIADVNNISIFGYGAVIKCPNNVSSSSGLRFTSVTKLEIYDLTVSGCTHPVDTDIKKDNNLKACLSFFMSQNIGLHQVKVLNGPDTGLALINVVCRVLIDSCSFNNNGYSRKNGGNGVYVELGTYYDSDIPKCNNTNYRVVNCTMANNLACTKLDDTISGFSRFDKGGGLFAIIIGVSRVFFKIINCSISNNTAYSYGGGLYTSFHGKALNSSYSISDSNISFNKARHGGGLFSGYLHNHSVPMNCSYLYDRVLLKNNAADFGGGLSVYSTTTRVKNTIPLLMFVNCTWISNEALFGSALAVLPNAWNELATGYLPALTFQDLIVCNNSLTNITIGPNDSKDHTQLSKGAGIFYCSSHMLSFSGYTKFSLNQGSALYMERCIMHFTKNSKANFTCNTAYQGGAMFMLGSLLYIHDNTSMIFDSNIAYESGGAIYSKPVGVHAYNYSKTCFLDYSQDEVAHNSVIGRNINVLFRNNRAQSEDSGLGIGQSIFVSSLNSCYNRKALYFNKTTLFLKNVGTVSFEPKNRNFEISTDVERYEYQSRSVMLYSGREEILPFENKDELNQTTSAFYFVSIIDSDEVTIDESYRRTSRNRVKVYGRGNSSATLVLSYRGSRYIEFTFNIKIKMCPPGYVEKEKENSTRCECSVDSYVGIKLCNNELFIANRRKGFWVGYDKSGSENENMLLTGYCPFNFCRKKTVNLSSSANTTELSDLVCEESRTGILCGECKPDFVVHYHSINLECKNNTSCSYGWILYTLSEILPVTLIFVLVILFNLSFTSGVVNGFVFYCQVVEFFPITAYDVIPLNTTASILYKIHQGVYQILNLSPLMISEMSYCVLPKGNGLDILMFSYVTLLYALLLIIFLLLMINKCKYVRCKAFRKLLSMRRSARSTIHGLAAFLLLCYAQCGKTSIYLLYSVKLYKKNREYAKTALYYNGEVEWMCPDHLRYAIPAVIMLFTFIVIPPFLLLVYPLHYKVMAILKVDEAKLFRIICQPLDKIKPLFDSFQGTFKDKYRFFAGLYFVYRFVILLIITIFEIQEVYFLLELLLIVILTAHVICQPYKNGNHNKFDTLLFINMVVINTISYYNFGIVSSDEFNEIVVRITTTLQNIMILLPSFVMVIYLVKQNSCVSKITKGLFHKKQFIQDEEELLECASRNRFDSYEYAPHSK